MAINFLNNGYFAGKVGIGVETPLTTLHLYDTGGSILRLASDAHTDNNKIEFDALNNGTIYHSIVSNTSSGNLQIRAGDNGSGHEVNIYTDGLFAATFDNNQRLGIGTTTPQSKLQVAYPGNVNGGSMLLGEGGSGNTKWGFLAGTHYNQATGSGNGAGSAGVALIGSFSNSSTNVVYIGGGPYEINAATQIKFYTNSTNLSTQGGTHVMNIANDGAIRFNAYGAGTLVTDSSGNITVSSGGGAGGPYLPLIGGTLTGPLIIDTAGGAEKMTLNNEFNTAPIADTFTGNTSKSYISFGVVAGSNDPGFIMHESSATETNEGVLHLCPSDDNSTGDYISIHGSNDPDVLNLHTSGLIETVNLQLQIKSGSGNVYLNDSVDIANNLLVSGAATITSDLTVNGGDITLGGTGRIQGIDTVSASTDAANKNYVDSNFAQRYSFNIGSSGGARRYIKLWTMTDTDDGVSGFLSMSGDYGDNDKGAYQLLVGTRSGNISMDVFETSIGGITDNFEFFYKDIGTSYEIWMLASDYNYPGQTAFIPVATFGGVTYNFDSITTTAPSGLVSVSNISFVNTVTAQSIGGAKTFTSLVSGITPTAAANFVTKAYVDGSGGGTGPFLPLAGGTMSGPIVMNNSDISGVKDLGVNSELAVGIDVASKTFNYGSEFTANGASIQFVYGRTGSATGKGAIGADQDSIFSVWNVDSGAAERFRMAKDGGANFTNSLYIPDYIYHVSDTNTFFGFNSNDQWKVTAGGNVGIQLQNTGVYLYYGGNEKLRTTSTGVSVTGGLSAVGGMSFFETTLTNNDDWQNSPISINERANIGSGSTADKYAPNLNFHWGSIVSNSLWMGANGNLNYGSYSSAGIPGVNGTFAAGNLVAASAITGNTGAFTGQVTGPTPSTTTSFANKAYVDAHDGGAGVYLPLAGGTMTGDIQMQDELINFYTSGSVTLPQFRGLRSATDLNNRSWSTEGGWAYTTFDSSSSNTPSSGLHNANGLLSFNTHSGDYMAQIAMTTNTGKLWHRRRNGSGWLTWYQIYSTQDFSTTNISNWNTAYNNMVTAVAITGTTTKTITLTQQDGGTVSNTFSAGIIQSVSDDGGSTINVSGSSTARTVAAVTGAVSSSSANLATGAQIQTAINTAIDTIPSGLAFEGNWNASTDSPDLSGASPDNGQFWIVSVAGSTNLSGITDWKVGDWAIYVATGAGTDGWQKVDNTSTLSGAGTVNALPLWTGTTSLGTSRFTQSSTQNLITGPGNAGSDNSLRVNNAAGTNQLYIQGTGEVVVSQNYFYVAASQGMYSNGLARFRGGVTNDQGNLNLGGSGSTGNLTLTSNTAASFAGTLSVGSITNATTDTDRFLVSDGSVIKYRTGAQVRSDIGAGTGNGNVTTSGLTAGRVSFATSSTNIEDDGDFVFDSSNNVLFTPGLLTANTRVSNSQHYPTGHYTPGETIWEIDPTWSDKQLKEYFNNNNVSWSTNSIAQDAPGGYAIYINGAVSVGGVYGSGFPYIPVDNDGVYYMECYIKNVGVTTHYMGSNEFNATFANTGGNPGSFGYWVMSNTNPGTSWTKVSGYIGGFDSSQTGKFELATKYWTPQALFNYTNSSGTRACYISGWKAVRVDAPGNRYFDNNVNIGLNSLPTTRLQVSSSGANGIDISEDTSATSNSGRLFFSTDTASEGVALLNGNGTFYIRTGAQPGSTSGATKFSITAAGNTDISGYISTPSYVYAGGAVRVPYASASKMPMIVLNGATTYGLFHTEASADIFSFDFNGSSKQSFDQNGNATFVGKGFSAATTTSDSSTTLTTKGYVDGLTPGAGVFLPLAGGTMANTNLVTNMNADLLDGINSGSFLRNDVSDTASQRIVFSANATNNWDTIATASGSQGGIEIYNSGAGNDAFMTFHAGNDFAFYFGIDADNNQLSVGGWSMGANKYKVWNESNDGAGSGLDADLLDGLQATSFLRSDAADTSTGEILFDAGFKSDSILLSGAQNFDNISRSGFYNLYNTSTGSTNSPPLTYGTMIVVGGNKQNSSFGLQIAHERTGAGMYVRGMNDSGSTWYDWDEIWNSGNDGAGSGLDADLLDGQQGSYYVNTSTAQSIAGVKSFSGKIGADGGIDGLTLANGGISGSNYNITGVNQLVISDPGEGIVFTGTATMYLNAVDDATDSILKLTNATQLNLNSTARITNLVDPSSAQDAATKSYVDAHPGTGGTVTSVATGGGLDGGTITTTGTIEVEYDGVPTNIIQSGFDFTGDTVVPGDYMMISDPGQTTTNRRIGYVTVGDLPKAPQTTFTRDINASTWTMLCTVNGDRLASIVDLTITGTSNGVVLAASFEIIVNHYQDIHVRSMSGDYLNTSIRITSNNNEDFSIEAKAGGGSTTTVEVCVFPRANEAITPTTTDPGYTGEEYVHTAVEGWRFGGEDGNTTSARVSINGALAIGTTFPGKPLTVNGTIRAEDNNSGDYIDITNDGSVSGHSKIETSNGNLIIDPSGVLDVQANAVVQTSNGVGDFYIGNYATANHFRFHTNNSQTYFDMNCGQINWRQGSSTRYYFYPSTANMTINGTLTQNSDSRVKENVVEIDNCISKVQAMRGVYYNRTDFNTEVTKVGVIAQEVEAVLPELILEASDTGLKSVAYAELTAVLINAIKEQQEIIDDLKTRIIKLEK